MKLADIETARTQADRLKQANDMLALIEAGPMRLMVGTGGNQAEIILTAEGEKLLKRLATEAVNAMRTDASEQLSKLGIEIGSRHSCVPASGPASGAPSGAASGRASSGRAEDTISEQSP